PPRMTRLIPYRSLVFLGTGSVGPDYLDVILRRGREDEAADALAWHLGGEGLVIELAQLHRGSSLARTLVARLTGRGWWCLERPTDVCPFIPFGGASWAEYLSTLDSHHRGNFRRRLNQLDKAFDLRFERAVAEPDRQAALRTLIHLHHLRWRERGGSTALYGPELVAFHEEWTRLALERGGLRLYLLWLDGKALGAAFRTPP